VRKRKRRKTTPLKPRIGQTLIDVSKTVNENAFTLLCFAISSFTIKDLMTKKHLTKSALVGLFLILNSFFVSCATTHKDVASSTQILYKTEPMIRVKVRGRRGRTNIVALPLETYLAGVIGHEMSPRWPAEALKAQTVAARSYALFQMTVAKLHGRNYDVVDSQADQVFRVNGTKNAYLQGLVNETRGEVVWKDNRIVQAFYSSTCGGQSETAQGAGLSEDSPLNICKQEDFCSASPFWTWSAAFTPNDLARRLSRRGYPSRRVSNLKIELRNPSGYAQTMTYNNGKTQTTIAAKSLRNIVGTMRLKSLLFDVTQNKKGYYVFSGRGFGHGVGLCQYGAKVMAEENQGYRKILSHYYDNTQIKRVYK
jgi:stage II sporulation protein D